MSGSKTAEKAKPFDGDMLYQQRARIALPLLVRQAIAQKTICYGELAEELGMQNARNLNFVLGSIGQSLIQLENKWKIKIPRIQFLVVNKVDGLPGEGIGTFIPNEDYKLMSRRQRQCVVEDQLKEIFTYSKWFSVLEAFSLKPTKLNISKLLREASQGGLGGGESEHHKLLKMHVAEHPEILDLAITDSNGSTEYPLPSGDKLDVLFECKDEWVAVEVKSHISSDGDLVRGLFQCVKYQSVLEAFLLSESRPINVRTLLVVSRKFPKGLIPLRNLLGVEVIHVKMP